MINYFDPREYVRGLQQILISDTKKIGFLFGAGTSFATKPGASLKSRVPAIKEMTQKIIDKIKLEEDKDNNKIFEEPINTVISDIEENDIEPNIEEILTNITQKEKFLGRAKLDGLDKDGWKDLRVFIENEIKSMVSVHKDKDEFIKNLIHCDFTHWIKNINRKFPIEIFTTNYDYLLELGFEYNDLPYYDGFIGSYKPFFYQLSVEDLKFLPEVTKLWKLHGSLGLDKENNRIIRRLPDDSTIMIYPSIFKYDNSKKQPYTSFFDRLGNFIKQDDSILFICGYSFGDDHINDIIINSLEKNPSSHVVTFIYDEYNEDDHLFYSLFENHNLINLAKNNPNLSIFGMIGAIIGGNIGLWKLKEKVSEDEDAILLDLFFEDRFATEGYIPKFVFCRFEEIQKEDSIKIWDRIKECGYIDDKGVLTKKFFDEEEDIKLNLEEKVSDLLKKLKDWSGEGVFKLPEFAAFVKFLTNLNSEDYIKKMIKK